jgi:hypothetical protein
MPARNARMPLHHQLSIAAKPQPKVNTAGATFKELP